MEDAWGEGASASVDGAGSAVVTAVPPSPSAATLLYTLRVVQLDAARLDELLVQMLRRQLGAALEPLNLTVLETHPSEVQLFLVTALYALTMVPRRRTYGQSLLNLRYGTIEGQAPTNYRMAGHYALSVLAPWLWERLSRATVQAYVNRQPSDPTRSRLSQVMAAIRRLEKAVAISRYLNHLLFLRNGLFLSITDRLCGMRSVYAKQLPRRVSYDFINRELLWHGFSEFAVFILPYINLRRAWRTAGKYFWKKPPAAMTAPSGMADPAVLIGNSTCAVCGTAPPWSAHQADCGDVFCYYCAATNCVSGGGEFDCPKCSGAVSLPRLRRLGQPALLPAATVAPTS